MVEINKLPLLPLRGLLVFPYMIVHIDVKRERSVAAIEAAMAQDNHIMLCAQKNEETDLPKQADLYDIGTVAEIKQLFKLPDGAMRILVEGLYRGGVSSWDETGDFTEVEVVLHKDENLPSLETDALLRAVIGEFERWVKLSKKIPQEAMVSVSIIDDVGRLCDLIASHLNLKLEDRQQLLAHIDINGRLEKLYAILNRELEILELEQKITIRVRKQMNKLQKEYYLREQIKAIKKELGDTDKQETDKYRQRLAEGQYPSKAREAILQEINKMEKLPNVSAELGVIRNYTDWLLDLPWKKCTEDNININTAKKILARDHYGLEKVKERILEYLAVHALSDKTKAPILCLVGPPGVGKTSLASSVAKATGRKFVRASLGGVRDEAEIRGHRRTYIGAMPGRIIEGLKSAGVNNPVFLLDEIDKLNGEYRGDPSSALLEALDPAQNSTFSDHFIEIPFDLSHVLWIVTANDLGNIPRALRDRMEIINLSSYTEVEKLEIAKRYLLPRQRTENGLTGKQIHLAPGVLQVIIADYTREAGVRELERSIGHLCRKAALKIVEGTQTAVTVTKKNIIDFLGKVKFPHIQGSRESEVGVCTGMAWTEVGGDILPTEVSVLPGKGKLILTGQLGDVMQESAKAGLSYIRSKAEFLHIEQDFYENKDVHIHLPEGAIPKDGPSAGITMVTAMVSALTKTKVRSDVAMTGEVTLRGRVLPIGGLKEKVIAAYREGIKTIILPKENTRDIDDIPASIRDNLHFIPVENMDEVLQQALEK